MKTLIILLSNEEKLEYLPQVKADITLYIGEMNLIPDPTANMLLFKGKLTSHQKEHIIELLNKDYDEDELSVIFIEAKENPKMPDGNTLVLK